MTPGPSLTPPSGSVPPPGHPDSTDRSRARATREPRSLGEPDVTDRVQLAGHVTDTNTGRVGPGAALPAEFTTATGAGTSARAVIPATVAPRAPNHRATRPSDRTRSRASAAAPRSRYRAPQAAERLADTRAARSAALRPRVLLASLVLTGALLAVFAVIAAVGGAGAHEPPLPAAYAQVYQARLVRYDHDVRARLARLGSSASVARARRHIRKTMTATQALAVALHGSAGADATRLNAAIGSELRFLDAVGSTLTNPRSPLRPELASRARAARAALAALDRPGAAR